MPRQQVVEPEHNRETSQSAKPCTIKRMQFTFSIGAPTPASWSASATKPDLKRSSKFKGNLNKRERASFCSTGTERETEIVVDGEESHDMNPSLTTWDPQQLATTTTAVIDDSVFNYRTASLLFPSLFSGDVAPSALLYSTPSRII